MVEEVKVKANKADVSEMRLYFDSQLTTDREINRDRFGLIE